MYNPNMNSNFIAEVRAEWNFERDDIMGNKVILYVYVVELFKFISMQFSQLEVTDIYYRGIYEHKRSLLTDGHLKISFIMLVVFI